jgi:hypothetical protein
MQSLPAFARDLLDITSVNLWFGRTLSNRTNGRPPKSSPLHNDGTDNLLYQIAGHKKLVLFSGRDVFNLCIETHNNTSARNPFDPELMDEPPMAIRRPGKDTQATVPE